MRRNQRMQPWAPHAASSAADGEVSKFIASAARCAIAFAPADRPRRCSAIRGPSPAVHTKSGTKGAAAAAVLTVATVLAGGSWRVTCASNIARIASRSSMSWTPSVVVRTTGAVTPCSSSQAPAAGASASRSTMFPERSSRVLTSAIAAYALSPGAGSNTTILMLTRLLSREVPLHSPETFAVCKEFGPLGRHQVP